MIKNNFDDVYYPENIEEILYKNVDEKMVDHIRRANATHLDEIALTFMGESVTYRELFARIEECAKALKSFGLRKGDCITLAMPNIPETIYYFYACNEIGVTPYLIDPRSTFNNMVECIKNSGSVLFVCEMGTYYSKVARYADKLKFLIYETIVVSPVNMFEGRKNVNVQALAAKYIYAFKKFMEELKLPDDKKTSKFSQKEFISLGASYDGAYKEQYDPDIPAIIVNTSGTSGTKIKGAMHSNKSYNIYANEVQFVTNKLDRGNTYYGYIPYFSMYGSAVGMHVALSYGVTINNIPKFNGEKSLKEIIDSKANILIGTPSILGKLTEMYEQKDADAHHVKQYIIGGDNMTPRNLAHQNETLLARGMESKIIYGYGATECMPVSTTSFDERSYLYGSAGMLYPMASVKIIDPETKEELPHGMEGEIYINNPTLMIGYLNDEEETKDVLVDIDGVTYYKSGDKGYLTDTGHLFLTGRYKRLMKRPDGHQVSPIPIENAICKHPFVNNCAVVGIKRIGNKPGVIPTAFVVLNNKEFLEKEGRIAEVIKIIAEDSLQELSGERDAALAYVVVDKLPYTINGKIDFNALLENNFDNLDFYVINDAATDEYFQNFPNCKTIKIDKTTVRTLRK
jgi:long-chain acyl-CoA synthetase